MRFGAETSDELLILADKHFDVFSFNCYRIEPNTEFIERIDRTTGLPCMLGEYHFGVPDRGMASGLVQVYSYADRGKAYQFYNEHGYAHPSLIGLHWFQWVDEPNTGRMDGENYNIGMVDITDRPYTDLKKAIRATHKRLYDIHNGMLAPTEEKPRFANQ